VQPYGKQIVQVGQSSKFAWINEQFDHPNQLQRWKSEATDKIHLIFTKDSDEVEKLHKKHESEIDDLPKQIGQLTIEVNWLKKKSGIK
jgi:transposase